MKNKGRLIGFVIGLVTIGTILDKVKEAHGFLAGMGAALAVTVILVALIRLIFPE